MLSAETTDAVGEGPAPRPPVDVELPALWEAATTLAPELVEKPA